MGYLHGCADVGPDFQHCASVSTVLRSGTGCGLSVVNSTSETNNNFRVKLLSQGHFSKSQLILWIQDSGLSIYTCP